MQRKIKYERTGLHAQFMRKIGRIGMRIYLVVKMIRYLHDPYRQWYTAEYHRLQPKMDLIFKIVTGTTINGTMVLVKSPM